MHQATIQSQSDVSPTSPAADERSARVLAKTIYRELRQSGLDEKQVLAIASELLGLVAEEVRGQ